MPLFHPPESEIAILWLLTSIARRFSNMKSPSVNKRLPDPQCRSAKSPPASAPRKLGALAYGLCAPRQRGALRYLGCLSFPYVVRLAHSSASRVIPNRILNNIHQHAKLRDVLLVSFMELLATLRTIVLTFFLFESETVSIKI